MRSNTDADRVHTYVDNEAFTSAGVIRTISLHAAEAGRPLRIGIYRQEGDSCNYRLLQQTFLASVPSGVNTVSQCGIQRRHGESLQHSASTR